MLTDTAPFLWGVATSGYQSEGGYNGPEQPQNNWSRSEHKGKVMPTGRAIEFWHRYPEDFRVCQRMGLNSFRLGLEWARIQPSSSTQPAPAPDFDESILRAYGDRLAACYRHGLEPLVTLHHFTHPAWLGIDAWLVEETIDHFAEYVRVAVTQINRHLIDQHGLPPIHWYITINEPNILISNTYLSGQFPAKTRGVSAALQAYNHLLAAHVRAYNCIHDLYEAEGWSAPQVSLNTYCSDLYWSEKVIWDLLALPQQQIKPTEIRSHIDQQAQHLEKALENAHLPFRSDLPYRLGRLARSMANRLGAQAFKLEGLDCFFRELEASSRTQVFDYLAIDYYDPFIAHIFRLPSFRDFEFETRGLRAWLMSGITSKWWDWRSLPEGLHFFCKFYTEAFDNRYPILIAENGMALRRRPDNAIATHRPDRLQRSEFLKAHIHQVKRLLQEGVPLQGYFHWSLTDNYEWGTYTPRFGLYSIDFSHGTDRLVEDHLGDRPSETYANLVQEARFGENKQDEPPNTSSSFSDHDLATDHSHRN